ncbi:hypothetical protein ACFX43_22150 [Nocardioides sp. YIM B13467]|uniref:hypothetical protein n=1 Tax=Nocardioides sp. YIM B13467 TaxID=3366294 RepID=UPI0036721C15
MTTSTPEPAPTGPEIRGPEVLRRVVPEAAMKDDGRPSSSAFMRSSHDSMMSTFREGVPVEDVAAAWKGKSPLAGVWPVGVIDGSANGAKVYDDGLKPCACGGANDGCEGDYPDGHASVDLREIGRSRRERLAKQFRDAAVQNGALLKAAND